MSIPLRLCKEFYSVGQGFPNYVSLINLAYLEDIFKKCNQINLSIHERILQFTRDKIEFFDSKMHSGETIGCQDGQNATAREVREHRRILTFIITKFSKFITFVFNQFKLPT